MQKQHYIINSKAVRKRAADAVMQIKGDDDMEVIIRKREHSKTAEQRSFFHFLCKALGDETGYTLGEIKEMVKMEILGTKIVEIAGRHREVVESSEAQNKLMYSALIEGVYKLGAEAGVQLPNARWDE